MLVMAVVVEVVIIVTIVVNTVRIVAFLCILHCHLDVTQAPGFSARHRGSDCERLHAYQPQAIEVQRQEKDSLGGATR